MVASVLLTLPSARLFALALVAAASLLHFTASLPDRRWVMPMLVACGTLVLVAPLVSVVASRVSWLWPRLFARRGASPGANPGASTGGGPAREPRRGAGGTPGLLSFVRLVVALLLAGPLLLWLSDHGVQAVHAGLVARDNRGVLFGGPSGAGKSSRAVT